jgi:hypothetical protein
MVLKSMGLNYFEKVETYTKLGSCFLVQNTRNQKHFNGKGRRKHEIGH